MDPYLLFTLIAATFSGASIGSLLFLSLLYPVYLKTPKNIEHSLFIYRRLYRLNSALCLVGGICAALIKNQAAAFMLTILAVSYIFNHSHILKGLLKSCNMKFEVVNRRNYQSLSHLQNLLHLAQICGAGYVIYLLAKNG